MENLKKDEIRKAVQKTYGDIAKSNTAGCGCSASSCCDPANNNTVEDISIGIGYSKEDVSTVPPSANMGLGCGNPHAIASLQLGETVLDLGSGGGFDCFLAAKAVGENGSVIGVDMTPEMVHKARENAVKAGLNNVEFRLGEIENLPIAENSVDVIISNCVINLSPEKSNVIKEAFRVLKKGGRLAVSDIVTSAQLPDDIKNSLDLHTGCVSGASNINDLKAKLKEVGFSDIRITPLDKSKEIISKWIPGSNVKDFIVSASIEAIKLF